MQNCVALIVQKVDNAIHWIIHHPAEKYHINFIQISTQPRISTHLK